MEIPVYMVTDSKREPIACYAAWTKDERILMGSSSGGAFTELSRVVLAEGGVVFGAAWKSDFSGVVHKCVECEKDLDALRGSKYTVSDMSGVYRPMSQFLKEGRKVLFFGMPCQVAAIRKVFGNDNNLFLCALICMSNADAQIWSDYISQVARDAGSKVIGVRHRAKRGERNKSCFVLEFQDGSKNVEVPIYRSEYWNLFASHPRKVCQSCKFRRGMHGADIQIGDFWGVDNFYPELNKVNGVSAILVYSTKGVDLISHTKLNLLEASYDHVLAGNPYLEKQYFPQCPRHPSFVRRCRSFAGRFLRKVGLR